MCIGNVPHDIQPHVWLNFIAILVESEMHIKSAPMYRDSNGSGIKHNFPVHLYKSTCCIHVNAYYMDKRCISTMEG